jgi:NodT family efflux transporter outer membrane factor (OMF) lipoprotein
MKTAASAPHRFRRWAALLAAVLVPAGCTVGPNYHRPQVEVSDRFSHWPATQPATIPAGQASPNLDLAHWWEAMGDEELNSLLARAVQSNLDIQIAITRLQQARVAEAVFYGAALPDLNFSAAAARGTGTNETRGRIDGPLNAASNASGLRELTHLLGADTEFELDLFGNLRRQGQAVAADAVAAGELRNQVLITVLGDVTRSYVLIRTLQLRVAIAEQAIDAQRQSAQVVRTRFARGITNELDVALANRELETTEAVLAPLQARLVAAKRNLAVLLGEPPDSLMRELVSESPLPTPPTEVAAGLPGDLLRRRPDVRQAEAQIIAANARLGVAISNLYPRIFLTAGGGVQGQGLGRTPVTWRGVWSAGPTVEWPLLDFGTVDAQIQQQDQITREQVANYRKLILAAIQQVDDSLTNYDAERSRLGSLTRAVAAAQRALELATERYNRGIINYLNVVDAERELYNLQDQFAVSENTAVADFVDICQSLGGGWQGFAPPPPLRQPLPAILATANDIAGKNVGALGPSSSK